MKRQPLSNILSNVGAAVRGHATQLAVGATAKWLEDNREELIAAVVQARHERGAQLLHEFCRQFPVAAGAVQFAMSGDRDLAISAIALYDAALADQCRKHLGNFAKLQECYQRGGEERQ